MIFAILSMALMPRSGTLTWTERPRTLISKKIRPLNDRMMLLLVDSV
jgi:hypothetical protein